MKLRIASLAILSCTLAACAAREAEPRHLTLLSDTPAPAGRSCTTRPLPEPAPAADLIVDSAGLNASLATLRDRPGTPRGYLIASLLFDENGWNARREIIEHDVGPDLAREVQALVFEHRREVEPGEPWGARLRIDLGDPIRLRVGGQELCEARVRGSGELTSTHDIFDVRSNPATGARGGIMNTVWVRVGVDPSGRITSAAIERTPVRLLREESLLRYVESLTFEPALVDGLPVEGTVRVPIIIR
jgi:TonB family protein